MLQDSFENEKYLQLRAAASDSFVKVHTFRRKSRDNYYIHGEVYEPREGDIRSLVFFIHGMSDYRRRYDSFARFLAKEGHTVVLFDLRGHGESLVDGQRGFFFYNEGSERQIDDISLLIAYFKGKYSDPKTIIIGHSLGSLFARAFVKKNPSDLSALLLLASPAWKKGINFAWIYSGIVSFFSPLKPAKSLWNKLFMKSENKFNNDKSYRCENLRYPSINNKFRNFEARTEDVNVNSHSNVRQTKSPLSINEMNLDSVNNVAIASLTEGLEESSSRNIRAVKINKDADSLDTLASCKKDEELSQIRKSRPLHCGFIFKWRAMRDVFDLMREVYLSKNWTVTQKNLPIRFLTGAEDNNIAEVKSGGVERAVQRMKNLGYRNVEAIYFNHTGHDILFSKETDAIYKYIGEFLENTLK